MEKRKQQGYFRMKFLKIFFSIIFFSKSSNRENVDKVYSGHDITISWN
jgi:hypothetical protein